MEKAAMKMVNKKIMRYMYYILMFLPLAVTVISLLFLPDRIPAHYGSDNQVTRWGSKYETLIFPAETLICGAIMTAVAKSAAGKERENNEKAVVIIGMAVLLLFNLMTVYFLYADFRQVSNLSDMPVDITGLVFCYLGAVIILCGILMPGLKRNSMIGLRTKWSMKNEVTWKKSQKFGGISFIIAGVCIIIVSLQTKGTACVIWSLGLLTADAVIDVIYTYIAARKYS